MNTFNYTAFTRRVPFQLVRDKITANKIWPKVGGTVLGIAVIVAFVLMSGKTSGVLANIGGMSIMVGAILVAANVYNFVVAYKKAVRQIRAEWFAQDNSFELLVDIKKPRYKGVLFNKGVGRYLEEGYSIPSSQGKIEIGRYEYVMSSGHNNTTYTFSYVRLPMPRRLPHMVLDSRRNNILGLISTVAGSLDKNQVLHLEGDFDKYFTLYAPKEYERDALYIFTPDVMATLIDMVPSADVELVDDYMIVYATKIKDITVEENVQSLLRVAEVLGARLGHQVDYYADERVGGREKNMIAPKGKRLKTGGLVGLGLFLVLITSLIVAQYMADPELGLKMALLMVGLPVMIVVVVMIGLKTGKSAKGKTHNSNDDKV